MQSKHVPILCCLDNKRKRTIIPGPQPINPITLCYDNPEMHKRNAGMSKMPIRISMWPGPPEYAAVSLPSTRRGFSSCRICKGVFARNALVKEGICDY